MLLKLTTPSYRSLDGYKFMDNENKYFALTKSTDSFDNRSTKSSNDANNPKNRTDSPSTVSYELLNDTYYEAKKFEQDIVLKAISSISAPVVNVGNKFQSFDTKKGKIFFLLQS
jgi:hypothetical protein